MNHHYTDGTIIADSPLGEVQINVYNSKSAGVTFVRPTINRVGHWSSTVRVVLTDDGSGPQWHASSGGHLTRTDTLREGSRAAKRKLATTAEALASKLIDPTLLLRAEERQKALAKELAKRAVRDAEEALDRARRRLREAEEAHALSLAALDS